MASESVAQNGTQGVLAFEAVALDERDAIGEAIAEEGAEASIDVARDHCAAFVEQRFCENACARTNFEDDVARRGVRCVNEFADEVVVDQEILAKHFLGREAPGFEHVADLSEGLHWVDTRSIV